MAMKRHIKLLVTGGGTGGHLFPGISVTEAVLNGYPGSAVMFVGTKKKMDTTTLKRYGFKTRFIHCQGLKGKNLFAALQALLLLPVSIWEALTIIRKFKPHLVFGLGGYVSGPVVLAARLLGVPACIHEQNSIPGLANRLLARFTRKIFISLPGSEKYFPPGKTILSGNPVRREILAVSRSKKIQPANFPADQNGPHPITILILGGSQGAHRLNMLMLEAVEKNLSTWPADLRIIHQTGEHDEGPVKSAYASLGDRAEVAAFFHDMATVYDRADLIISRAGATTLAEVMVLGKAAILIPYPHAADNHQVENGLYLSNAGAARMFMESDLTGDTLGREITRLVNDKDSRERLGRSAGELAMPNATETIVEACLELLGDVREAAGTV